MPLKMNRSIFWKCGFIGLFLTIVGMILQLLKSKVLFHAKPPSFDFIIAVTIFYFLAGFLFALGYFIVKSAIPGKSRVTKGLFYALLVYFGIAFAGLIGIIGLDFVGRFDLFTSYKIENYAIALTDFINFMLTGMALGVVAEEKDINPIQYPFIKKRVVLSSVVGFFFFPILNILTFRFLTLFVSSGFNFPPEAEQWFYIGTFIPLSVSGAIIPFFYSIVKNVFNGNVIQKGCKFFIYNYLCFWVINICFGLPFGFSLQAVGNFLISLIPPLIFLVLFSAKLVEEKKAVSHLPDA